MWWFHPKRRFREVLIELAEGLADGTIVLDHLQETAMTRVLTKDFADLAIGDCFYFPGNMDRKRYTKVEETRRSYTPEAYSNAYFDWQTIDPRTDTLISEGRTFFYVTPTTDVIPAPRISHAEPDAGRPGENAGSPNVEVPEVREAAI